MRKTRLIDCNPQWVENYYGTGQCDAVRFDCPEGHDDCIHVIPFSPNLAGGVFEQRPFWRRAGGDSFETLTLTPSIRRNPTYKDRAQALAKGCLPEYITDSMFCHFHGHIVNGQITFCGDSG